MTTLLQMVQLLDDVQIACPSFYKGFDSQKLKRAAELWLEAFSDVDFQVLRAAAIKHTMTNKWPPTIAELREATAKIQYPQLYEKTPDDAWGDVKRAISRYGYTRGPDAMATLDGITQRVIGNMGGWVEMCSREVEYDAADRARFIEAYKIHTERKREFATIAAPVAELIQGLAVNKTFPDTPKQEPKQQALPVSVEAIKSDLERIIKSTNALPDMPKMERKKPLSDEEFAERKAMLLKQVELMIQKETSAGTEAG